MKKYFLKISKSIWILIVIVILGFGFRVYHHHDFLRFNPDQARDASLVQNVVNGKEAWPLLGPKAGGTEFRLGGFFYQIEIVNAKLLGSTPDRLAFPALFFSILSIILLYFFLREFFETNIALVSTALMAVSFYTVKYARFAWNPNSIPFYVLLFLYAALQLSKKKKKRKWLWATLIGLAAGIGAQLHSLLLFSLPIILVAYFIYLFFKKNPAWKYAFLIITLALTINFPQIISEAKTGGKNVKAFFKGVATKSSRSGTYKDKLILDTVCHIQTNSFIVTSIGNDDKCDFIDVTKNIKKNNHKKNGLFKNIVLLGNLIFATVFSLGGYLLLVYFWHKEKEQNKKRFLEIILFYTATLFIILIPLADEISFRFFLVAEFLPFVFLGLWIKFFKQQFKKWGWIMSVLLVTILMIINLRSVSHQFSYLAGQRLAGRNGFEDIKLGEVEFMSHFIEEHSSKEKNIYLKGNAGELFKIMRPIKYFTNEAGFKLNKLRKNSVINSKSKLFLINITANPQENNQPSQKITNAYNILASGRFARVRIYQLEAK